VKRSTKLVGASLFAALLTLIVVLAFRGGVIGTSGRNLESVLANDEATSGDGSASRTPTAPSMQRDWIVNAVRKATGRTLDVEGELEAHLLPLPLLLLGKASLSNEDGFGDSPFATIEGMELRVGSMSPSTRTLTVERAALAGFRLRLARAADGASNWNDFVDKPEPAGGADAERDDATWRIAADALEIIDAEVGMQDAQTGREWQVRAFELRASSIRPGESFPLRVSFDFESPQATMSIEADMRFGADPSHLEISDVDFLVHRLDPAELLALLEFLQVTLDPEVLERARVSTSIRMTGGGTFDSATQAVDFRGGLQLGGNFAAGQSPPRDPPVGANLPLTIGGTLGRPMFEIQVGAEPR
jgi:hypothetical protein